MAWIEIHQSLPTHDKTWSVADALGMPPVHIVGHMTCFWLWALDNAPDGTVKPSARIVERAAQWQGEAGEFCVALIHSGYLHDRGDHYEINDWHSYAGKLIDRRKANAKRQKDWRDRNHSDNETPETRNAHVTVTSQSRNGATVPNPTVPNQPPKPPTEKKPAVVGVKEGREGVQVRETHAQTIARCEAAYPDRIEYVEDQVSEGNPDRPVPYRATIWRNVEAKIKADEAARPKSGCPRDHLGRRASVIGGMTNIPIAGYRFEGDGLFYAPGPTPDSPPVPADPQPPKKAQPASRPARVAEPAFAGYSAASQAQVVQ